MVMTHPMTSMSGYVTYLRYTVGSHKGNLTNGVPDDYSRYDKTTGRADTFNDPWSLGVQGKQRVEYTSAKVTTTGIAATGLAQVVDLKWSPVLPGTIVIKEVKVGSDPVYFVDETTAAAAGVAGADVGGHDLYKSTTAPVISEVVTRGGCVNRTVTLSNDAVKVADDAVQYGTTRDDRFNSTNAHGTAGFVSFPAAVLTEGSTIDVEYAYKYNCSIEINYIAA